MKKITQKLLLFTSIFALMMMGGLAFAEENNTGEEMDARERVDLLLEKVEELADLIVEMKEAGDLPLTKDEKATTETAECEPYLVEYITYGAENNEDEVEKLQVFLNDYMGEDIPVTGFYGEITMSIVNDFQVKHTEDILSPWGTTKPTGQVYKTTQRKINDIMCPDVTVPMPDISVDIERIEEVATATEEDEEEEETVFLEDTFFPLGDDNEEEEDEDDNGNELITGLFGGGGGSTNYLPILIIIVGLVGIASILYYVYSPKKENKGKLIS